ncbi:MAG: hypothetical protein P4L46_25160 [Fimbriimonas sp.]|nr:hypothetical protein [Fimbriimonas sp.]
MNLLAQLPTPTNFWMSPNGSTLLWIEIIGAFVLGFAAIFGLSYLPKNLRKPLIGIATFLGGLYFMLHYLWPTAQDYSKDQVPKGAVEGVSFWLQYSLPTVMNFNQVLSGLLLGLGIASLLRIHAERVAKRHPDWMYSLTLIVCMGLMAIFGLLDWASAIGPGQAKQVADHPGFVNFAYNFLFGGLFVNLDAVMYSMIAFFIYSAAYRSFRLRSIESAVLLGTAVLIMLSLMGGVMVGWDKVVDMLGGSGHGAVAEFMSNLRLGAIKDWVQNNMQSPSIRAIEFGLAVGVLAMSLRLWLGIEKGING